MGDRCYLRLVCRKSDQKRLLEAIDYGEEEFEVNDEGLTWIEMGFVEANYGLFEPRYKAAGLGIPFSGSHSAGGSYEASVFVSWAGRLTDTCCIGSSPVAAVYQDRTFNASDVQAAFQYYHDLALFNEYKEKPDVVHEGSQPTT